MATVAYIRCSTQEQHTEYQRQLLHTYANEHGMTIDKEFIEKASARNTDREQLQLMLSWVREGDTILCQDWSRISRSLKDLLGIVDELQKKHVTLTTTKEGTFDDTPTSRLMISVMGAVNQYQIDIQRDKALSGIAQAKAEGKYHGRKPTTVDKKTWEDLRHQYQTRQISKAEWSRRLGVSRVTLDKLIQRADNGESIFK